MHKPTAPDERIYAIGDVHGRLDLLGELIARIRADSATRGKAGTTIVQLGNLVGHGPASAELIARFMNYTTRSSAVVVLKGREEAMMADALSGNLMLLGLWLQLGGDAVLASWGVDQQVIASRHLPDLLRAAQAAIPREVAEWLTRLPLSWRWGDYLFVHATGRPAGSSRPRDDGLLRISNDLIDTAHDPRVLTALGLEAGSRWTVQAGLGHVTGVAIRQDSRSKPSTAREAVMERT